MTVTDLIVKAVGVAQPLVPTLSVQWNSDSIRQVKSVDAAVAVATDEGVAARCCATSMR